MRSPEDSFFSGPVVSFSARVWDYGTHEKGDNGVRKREEMPVTPTHTFPSSFMHKPVVREPVVREPVVREPVVREPIAREPIACESIRAIRQATEADLLRISKNANVHDEW